MKLQWTVIVIDCGHADCCQRIHYCWMCNTNNDVILYINVFYHLNYLNPVEINFNKKKKKICQCVCTNLNVCKHNNTIL